eukprot:3762351-Pyramimonas_sp.AAC.1
MIAARPGGRPISANAGRSPTCINIPAGLIYRFQVRIRFAPTFSLNISPAQRVKSRYIDNKLKTMIENRLKTLIESKLKRKHAKGNGAHIYAIVLRVQTI